MPGFGLTLGYTLAWLSLIVLIPRTGVFVKSSALGWDGLWRVWTDARVLRIYGCTSEIMKELVARGMLGR